jgi:putative ABC transport system permease protein
MLFLAEGLWLGLLGVAAGIAIALAIAHWLTGWVRGIVEGEFGREIDQPMFAFPPLLIISLVAVVIFVTVTASLLPALRAARIDPIRTLKSE